RHIGTAGAKARVKVPGLWAPLVFAQPTFGVVGVATPSSGFVTTSLAPRLDGQVTPPSATPKRLFVELGTAISGYRIGPLSGDWSFSDFDWLLKGLPILKQFPNIIPTEGLALRSFDLNVFSDAPCFSSLSLAVGDSQTPLWTALDGKVKLTDVVVTLGLTYSQQEGVLLTGTGSVQGNVVLGVLDLQVQIPFPLDGVWSLTARPNLPLSKLGDLGELLDGGSTKLDGILPEGLSVLDNLALTYLRIAVDAHKPFSLAEFTFVVSSTATWKLIPDAIELGSLQIRITIDRTPAVTGSITGSFKLPQGSEIV